MNSSEHKIFPWEGHNKIFEDEEKATDAYDVELNLYKGRYEMVNFSFDIMIKKGKNLKLESYDLLRNFRHDTAIELLDFYTDDEKRGCLIIPKVDTMFKTWFQNGGKLMLFNQSGHMTTLLKNMIIGYASLVGNLMKRDLIIEKFDMEDLYMSLALLKLCILLPQVKEVKVRSIIDENKSWNQIRKFVSWCAKNCHVKMDTLTESFCNYIGKSYYEVERLKSYPDDWGYTKKGEYLLSLVGANHGNIGRALGEAKIDWPYEKEGGTFYDLPILLQKILDWEDGINHRVYNILDAMSYINLLRNLYKHHEELPEEIKAILVNRKAIIEVIEQWSPGIWIRIYERTVNRKAIIEVIEQWSPGIWIRIYERTGWL